MLAIVVAVLVGQITNVKLGPISVRVDPGTLRFDGVSCGVVSSRRSLVTNTGKDDLFIRHGLVFGPHFNGGLTTGSLGRNRNGESQDMEFVYAPDQPDDDLGWVDVLAEYHGDVIIAERARIEALAKKDLQSVADEIRELLDEKADDAVIFDAMDAEARKENRRAHERIDAALAQSARELMYIRDEYEKARQEYLAGNFCTGCGSTRSEILAEGPSAVFPHQGQDVRAANANDMAKLAAKFEPRLDAERQKASRLRQDIDSADTNMRRTLDSNAAKKQKAKELVEKQLASLQAEERSLEVRRKELQAEVTVFAGKQTVTRITLQGRCARTP